MNRPKKIHLTVEVPALKQEFTFDPVELIPDYAWDSLERKMRADLEKAFAAATRRAIKSLNQDELKALAKAKLLREI